MPWIRPLTLTVALVMTPALGLAGDLTTRDVVELSRSGLGDEVLIALVEVDGGPFDLSPADLLDLKAEGLSARVMAALVRAGRHHYAPHTVTESPNHGGLFIGESHVTHTVAVPVPVYVPVYTPRTSRRHDRRRGYDAYDAEPEVTPGRGRGPVTADSIRHAPPGFHPGSVRSRATTTSDASARPEPQAPSTPGIARSTRSAERPPTPGVARSHRAPER